MSQALSTNMVFLSLPGKYKDTLKAILIPKARQFHNVYTLQNSTGSGCTAYAYLASIQQTINDLFSGSSISCFGFTQLVQYPKLGLSLYRTRGKVTYRHTLRIFTISTE